MTPSLSHLLRTLAALGLLVLIAPSFASSALISSFSYTIDHGTAKAPLGSAIVLSGSTVTATPHSPVDPSCFLCNGYTGWVLSLTGVSSGGASIQFTGIPHEVGQTLAIGLFMDLSVAAPTPYSGFLRQLTTGRFSYDRGGYPGFVRLDGSIRTAANPDFSLASVVDTLSFRGFLVVGSEVQTPVPEPATGALLGIGLGLLGIARSGRPVALRAGLFK